MDFVTLRVRRLDIIDYHVKPNNGRRMSTIIDCTHHIDEREYIPITYTYSCQRE